MTYTPNFKDPRVVKRITQATTWARACLRSTEPKPWGTRKLDQAIGHQTNPLGRYLRQHCVIVHDDHYNHHTGKAKTYLLNEVGVSMLERAIGIDRMPTVSRLKQWAEPQWHRELITGQFKYDAKTDRLWHPLQRVATDERTRLFAEYGYRHDYDIETAAPTLLYQRACAINPRLSTRTPYIEAYLLDRTEFRQYLSQHLGISVKATKSMITAFFAGATLQPGRAIHQLVDLNNSKLAWIRRDPRIANLRKDIKRMWDVIKPEITTHRLNARLKWKEYFRLERQVMDVIRKYLRDSGNIYFSEHDGWRCHYLVDTHELELVVRNKTGFVIKINGKDV